MIAGRPTGRRRAALRAALRDRSVDALLVTDLINVRYLTGFTGSNAALLVVAEDHEDDKTEEYEDERGGDAVPPSGPGLLAGRTTFCTDGRYAIQSAGEVPDLPRLIDRPCDTALIGRMTPGQLAFEARAVSVADAERHRQQAPPGVQLVASVDLVERLRAVKDAVEVEALRRACAVADRAFAELLDAGGVRAGRTEREVGLDLDQRMRVLGASDPSFETIVAAGANSAIPHHRPTGAILRRGDLVKFDFGAAVDGYHSDMTRTVVLGPPADWQREIHDLVGVAQAAGRAAVAPGARGNAVDAAARSVIASAGYGAEFPHGLGHGIGLLVHEAPSLAATAAGILAEDMCVTVEPGVYLPDRGGVRIEDSGVVRADGYEVLTTTSRALLVL